METKNNLFDYSKFTVIDFCYFLNGKADLTSNKYLKGFNPLILSKVEMYEYIKFKTDNFDKIKFQLVFDEIVSYCFEYMDFYRLEKVDGKFINKYVTDYEVDYNFTDKEPYEYICRTLELNKGLIVNCQQIIEFVKMAENEYNRVCKTTATTPEQNQVARQYQFTNDLTDEQRGKLFELLVEHGFISGSTDKAGFIWAFGGKNEKPSNWEPIKWIDESVTRHEPNMQTLFELLYLLKIDSDTKPSNPNNMYNKMRYCFANLKNVAAKNQYKAQQNTERQKLLKQIIEDIDVKK